jgi:uncharacterized protein (DUF1697 family)
MNTYIALFRGINVGGNNMLPMKALKMLMENSGCTGVQTYIQSGNVVFRSATDAPGVATKLMAAVSRRHGFEPRVLVLTCEEIEKAAKGNPFPEAAENPAHVHVFFLAGTPKHPDLKGIAAIKAKSERFALKGRVFYMHTPDGLGTSKLAARVERLLGVDATARNWRTVTKLIELGKAAG